MGCGRKPKEEAPVFDDGPTCPYSIKPSELFAMNAVGRGGLRYGVIWLLLAP